MRRSFTSTNACSVTASFWRPFAITVSPSIRGSEEVSPLTVVEGSLITLVCESSGIPPPSLTWTKDGKRVSALIKRGDAAQEQKLYMCGWRAGTPHLSCVLFIFQVLKWNLTSGSGFCQEVVSCRSPVLRRQMLLLTPAQPPVQLGPSPRSTACRFMVCKHHWVIHLFFSTAFLPIKDTGCKLWINQLSWKVVSYCFEWESRKMCFKYRN